MLQHLPLNRRSTIAVSLKPLRGLSIHLDPELYFRTPLCHLFEGSQDNAEVAVVHLAGFVIPFLGWRIKRIAEAFPDALYEDSEGRQIRAEFEIRSSHFLDHGHLANGCDLIICWEDDLGSEKRQILLSQNTNLKVLELKRFFHDYEVTVSS